MVEVGTPARLQVLRLGGPVLLVAGLAMLVVAWRRRRVRAR
jgi:hypothetical protein